MTDTPSSAHHADSLQRGITGIHVPEPSADTETLLLKIGITLPIVGVVLILIAYWNSSGSKYVADQIPMLISGGILGIGARARTPSEAAALHAVRTATGLPDDMTGGPPGHHQAGAW